MEFGSLDAPLAALVARTEIFPVLIARKIIVLFNPVAVAAAARLYAIMLPVVTLVATHSIVTDWLRNY